MPAPLPLGFDERPFSVREAVDVGVGLDRLRRRDLRAEFHGVRVPQHLPDDFDTRCRSYAVRLRAGQFLSHVTAARLWQMRLPWRVGRMPVHVTALLPARTPRTRGVVGHHADAPGPELVRHHGFLLPTPAETWRSLAGILTVDELIVAGDGLLSRHRPLATPGQLLRAVARNSGQRGNRSLRAALDEVRPGTDSTRRPRSGCCSRAPGFRTRR